MLAPVPDDAAEGDVLTVPSLEDDEDAIEPVEPDDED